MRDMDTPHKRMQELCDCFAETDPLKEMAFVVRDADKEEAALKWLALAVLHGIDRHAKKISFERRADGSVKAEAEYRDAELPSPGPEIGARVIDAARQITHIEGRGEIPLAVGIRDSSIELLVNVRKDSRGEKITLKFEK
ncbi:MAG: hypothetical protein ABSE25_11710 [Syntrophorhabdales bacterium]|jgi:hypothetical protein